MMNYILYGLLAGIFTWFLTILGSLMVYSVNYKSNYLIAVFLGFGGGVMVAASFFSLITPAINYCEELNYQTWLVCLIGFIVGIVIILLIDLLLGKYEINEENKNNTLMVLAVIIHNIPEGLAIGVAFGSLNMALNGTSLVSAIMLAVGIGLQNFPEGAAISIPLASTGSTKHKAFLIGSLSAIVEPIASVIGVILVTYVKLALPLVLVIAASIMIFVVIDEIITLSHKYHKRLTSIGFIIGFIIMMILDLAFS